MNFFIGNFCRCRRSDRRAYVDNFTQQPHEYAGVAAMVVDQLHLGGLI